MNRTSFCNGLNVTIVDEELDNNDVDDIGKLEDLPRLVFIDKECGNLETVDWWWGAYMKY